MGCLGLPGLCQGRIRIIGKENPNFQHSGFGPSLVQISGSFLDFSRKKLEKRPEDAVLLLLRKMALLAVILWGSRQSPVLTVALTLFVCPLILAQRLSMCSRHSSPSITHPPHPLHLCLPSWRTWNLPSGSKICTILDPKIIRTMLHFQTSMTSCWNCWSGPNK